MKADLSHRASPTVLISSTYSPGSATPARWFQIGAPAAYADAVRLAGGMPLVTPPLDNDTEVAEALRRADAVLLIGGPDVDPRSYGQEPSPHVQRLHPRRNSSDLRLARAAAEISKPLLGICGGMQTLNVALGGTLHQHIPAIPGLVDRDDHSTRTPDDNTHRVRLDPASRLCRIMKAGTELEVNSSHHQAVDQLGKNLRAVAWAPSGLIEGAEGPADGPFLVAVQWHPERLAIMPAGDDRGGRPLPGRADQLAIFQALVEAARLCSA